MIPKELKLEVIQRTYKNLLPHIIETPLVKGGLLIDDFLNTNSFFKLEFLQNAGTFKSRGATNNVLNLNRSNKVTYERIN